MEYARLGNDQVPVLGFGTWHLGGHWERDTTRDAEEVRAIRTAIGLGMTHLDTAELYGDGHAEELVARAMHGIPRDRIFLTTKVKGDHLRSQQVAEACTRSLQRLRTDHIDLYLVHWPNSRVPLAETMQALADLRDRGLIRHIGVSNFEVEHLKEARKHAPIVANQVEYSLAVREHAQFADHIESRVIPYCARHRITVIAYRPLAIGKLPHLRPLQAIAGDIGKTPAQVALNWLFRKGTITIPMSRNPAHIRENLGALGWKLSRTQVAVLDRLPHR